MNVGGSLFLSLQRYRVVQQNRPVTPLFQILTISSICTTILIKSQVRPSKSTANKYCSLWLVTYRHQPHGSKTYLLGRCFHTLIRNVSFPSPTDVGSHNPPPLGGLASSLTHRPVSGFNTICNSPNPPLANVVRFDPLRIAVSLTVLKRIY